MSTSAANPGATVLAQRSLDTPRLHLRPLQSLDIPGFWAINSDPAVARFLPYPAWTSMDDAHAWHARMQGRIARGEITYNAMVDRLSGEVMGGTLLMNWEPEVRKLEVGYVMARSHWGRGLMQEALRAEIDDAFTRWGLWRMEAHIDARNGASRALIERMGFQQEALLREAWADNQGAVTDATVYGLLRREWSAHAATTGATVT